MRGAVLPRRLDRSGVLAGVLAGVLDHATPTEGGVWHTQREGVWHTPRPCFAVVVRAVRRRASTRTAPAVRDKTGATPPFWPLARHGSGGVWHAVWHPAWHTLPAVGGGVAPVCMYPCGKAPRPACGPDDERHWCAETSVRRGPGHRDGRRGNDLDVKSRVHPRYKTKYRVGNWPAYDRALVQRGDVTLWLTPEAIATWEAVGVGTRGGQLQYSEVAIETALTLRLIFHLPLRQTEGFLTSIFGMLCLDLSAPREHAEFRSL